MEKNIFRYILKYSAKDQALLLLLIISFQPLYLLSLELPKIIINSLKKVEINQIAPPPYDIPFFGVEALTFAVNTPILNFLLLLSFMYLFIVLITGMQKYAINVYIGLVGERLLRRLRYSLYQRVLRFPLRHFRKVGDGAIIPMITQEVEPVGGFAGSAFADPVFQGGQLVIAIGYIIYQDWLLGMAALAFYPVQIVIIPKLQKVVNSLAKERVKNVRLLSDNLGTSIRGVKHIHANNTSPFELARFSDRIGTIFGIRYKIYRWKFFIKFLNNFIDKLTPFFFFSIGGWLALEGRLDIGALFAALNAYKDVAAPWKEMLRWYQTKEDVRIKYEQVIEQFEPKDMMDEEKLLSAPPAHDADRIELKNIGVVSDEGQTLLREVNLQLDTRKTYAIIGDGASRKSELALLLSGLLPASSGEALLAARGMSDYSESYLGRRIAYVDNEPFVMSGSLYDNMVYGIRNYCMSEGDFADFVEAQKSGNSTDNFHGDWIDWETYGLSGREDLDARLASLCSVVGLEEYLLEVGFQERLPLLSAGEDDGGVRAEILSARRALRDYLESGEGKGLVVAFDSDAFNDYASVLENLIFGRVLPSGDGSLSDDDESRFLISHPYIAETISRVGLRRRFLESGAEVVRLIDEIFADLPSGHNLYQRFSFVSEDDLPMYSRLLGRLDSVDDIENLDTDEQYVLFSLPFHLVPKLHRLSIVDDGFRAEILRARVLFRENLPEDLRSRVCFHDAEAYNDALDIVGNTLFGKVATDRAKAGDAIASMLENFIIGSGDAGEHLRSVVNSVGLRSHVGLRGERLSRLQRVQLVLVRGLLKGSDVLILDNVLSEFDGDIQESVLSRIKALRGDRGLILVTGNGRLGSLVDEVIFVRGADIVSCGSFSDLQEHADFIKLLG